jgi:hypothetical protein
MKEMMFDDSAITPASIARSGLSLKGKLDAFKIEFDINLAPPGRPSKRCIAPSSN